MKRNNECVSIEIFPLHFLDSLFCGHRGCQSLKLQNGSSFRNLCGKWADPWHSDGFVWRDLTSASVEIDLYPKALFWLVKLFPPEDLELNWWQSSKTLLNPNFVFVKCQTLCLLPVSLYTSCFYFKGHIVLSYLVVPPLACSSGFFVHDGGYIQSKLSLKCCFWIFLHSIIVEKKCSCIKLIAVM